MALNMHALIFVPADIAEDNNGGANVGSYTRAGSDGDLISSTNVGGKEGLDVNIVNASITTTTSADYAEDSAAADGDIGTFVLVQRHDANTSTVSADGDYSALHVDSSGFLKVSGSDFDIRDLAFATDSVDVSGSTVTVTATDLDIRDLTHVSDSVKIGDGTDFLAINADGSINVNADISVVNGSDKAEDAASASGDIGTFVLAVRQDTLASSTSTDGDYGAFKLTSAGALWTAPVGTIADDAADSGNPIKVGGIARATAAALDLADAADRVDFTTNLSRHLLVADMATQAVLQQIVSVTNTAGLVVASPLANRKKIMIQNDGNTPIYIGTTTVTSAGATGGIKIPANDVWEEDLAGGVALYAITASGTNSTIRVIEYA